MRPLDERPLFELNEEGIVLGWNMVVDERTCGFCGKPVAQVSFNKALEKLATLQDGGYCVCSLSCALKHKDTGVGYWWQPAGAEILEGKAVSAPECSICKLPMLIDVADAPGAAPAWKFKGKANHCRCYIVSDRIVQEGVGTWEKLHGQILDWQRWPG